MATPEPALRMAPQPGAIPPSLLNVCFVLFVAHVSFFPAAYFTHWWIQDANGLGFPTDFVSVWAAGRLVLDGLPAQAYDGDIQKQVEVALLGQDFANYFAWHYPTPFLFVAAVLAQFPYPVASLAAAGSVTVAGIIRQGINARRTWSRVAQVHS